MKRELRWFAVIEEIIEVNPAGDLRVILVAKRKKHYPWLRPEALPDFFVRLESYERRARRMTVLAIRLYMLTFLRNSELYAEASFQKLTGSAVIGKYQQSECR